MWAAVSGGENLSFSIDKKFMINHRLDYITL